MATATKKAWAYKVGKTQRGMQGEWFRYPAAATFATQAEGEQYARDFAEQQRGVAGTKILVVTRKGNRVVATVPVS